MKKRLAGIAVILVVCGVAVCAHAAVKETILYRFNRNKSGPYAPLSNLVMDKAGDLYGTTYEGGASGAGVAFELSPQSGGVWTYSVIHNFTGNDGYEPYGPLAIDSTGNLYGITNGGGPNGDGVLFELSPNGSGGWTETTAFAGTSSAFPSSVIVDSSGNLYGTATSGSGGNGLVFELTPSAEGWTFQDLFDFNGTDGATPVSITMDATGDLFGTTIAGGSSTNCKDGCGVVFELTQSAGTWSEQVLLNFDNSNGSLAVGSLTLNSSGDLFGTTATGGPNGYGVVFELSQSAGVWTQTILHAFTDANGDGSYPQMPLLLIKGALYGTTLFGGSSNNCSGGGGLGCGTAFRLARSGTTWKETILHSFTDEQDGGSPYGIATDGTHLYGVTQSGGSKCPCAGGVVYELSAP
jgi:uncharacterized repeat protein (TIGR03803 family)